MTSQIELDHEHADHPDYKFVVEIEYIGPVDGETFSWVDGEGNVTPMTAEEIHYTKYEQHALIYSDGYIAVTLFEHCYAVWHVFNGALVAGSFSLWKPNDWRLTEEAQKKIKEYARQRGIQI